MNALSGRFGSLSLEQTRWFSFMVCAYAMAPMDSDLRRECERLLNRACEHYGVSIEAALALVSPGLQPCEEDLPEAVS